MKWSDSQLRDLFPLDKDLIYLNHAAVSPWPQPTCDAVTAFAKENITTACLHYKRWVGKELNLRQQLKTLINAPSVDDIAILKSTSEALSVVAYGIDWCPGDNVVITEQEFPSNRIVWESLKDQGVSVKLAKLSSPDPEKAILDLVDAKTKCVSVSSVQYASGFRLDLTTLGHALDQRDVLFCVDAIQSIGALPLDVQAIHADFVMADGHKWMLGPEGVALFYCSEHVRDKLKLHQYGWHMVADAGNYQNHDWQITKSAQRFECGSPNMLGIHALEASVSLLLKAGLDDIEKAVITKTTQLIDGLSKLPGISILSETTPGRFGGIMTFKSARHANEQLFEYLSENNVVCALRGGGIRLSPHFYTPDSHLEQTIKLVADYVGFSVNA